MVFQTMLELGNPFDCYVRKLGYAVAMFLIAGSDTSNPQFIVRLYETNGIRSVDQNDILLYGNPGAGERFVPNIPEDWLSKADKKVEL